MKHIGLPLKDYTNNNFIHNNYIYKCFSDKVVDFVEEKTFAKVSLIYSISIYHSLIAGHHNRCYKSFDNSSDFFWLYYGKEISMIFCFNTRTK